MKTEDKLQRIRKRPQHPTPILTDVNADCQSIVINAPPSEVYRRLLRIEGLPQFIPSIVKIENITPNRFSCTAIINGQTIISEVTIMMRVPDRRIAWQAVSDQFRLGVIFLDPLLGGTTKLTVKIRSIMEPLRLTGALREYLRNFKNLVERDSV